MDTPLSSEIQFSIYSNIRNKELFKDEKVNEEIEPVKEEAKEEKKVELEEEIPKENIEEKEDIKEDIEKNNEIDVKPPTHKEHDDFFKCFI